MVIMAEYAPEALKWLGAEIVKAIPSAEFSGIVGDKNHTYGYHRARSVLPSSDYSVRTSPDKQGDADAASALDIKLNAKWMKIVTKRLMDSAKNQLDDRLMPVREFFGTLNGSTVAGWDVYYGRPATSDDSHLWHVHLSILRKYATSHTHMMPILSVIKGKGSDMELGDKVKLSEWIPERYPDIENGEITVRTALGSGYGHARSAKDAAHNAVDLVQRLETRLNAIEAKIDRLLEQ